VSSTESTYVDCPYCGERIEVIVDCSVEFQEYIEDCAVCCRPITLAASVDTDGTVSVMARHENET
jgi:hypothetical protein